MEDIAWQMQAAQNEKMLDHAALPQLIRRSNAPNDFFKHLLGLQQPTDSDDEDAYEDSPMDRMMKQGIRKNAGLPEDLRLTMKRRKHDIVNSAHAWVHDGGNWRANLTTVLPQYG